jgi:hypothetical protein
MKKSNNLITVNNHSVPDCWFTEVQARAAESSHFDVVEKSKPDKAALALMLLARGTAKKRVAEISGLDRGTISKLAWRHSETLESRKREMARGYAMAAEQYKDLLVQKAEQLEDNPEELAKISPDKIALAMAIATDKATMLSGMPTAVVEHRKGATLSDALALINAAKARIAEKVRSEAIEAEVMGG